MKKVITISATALAILSVFFVALSSINLNSGSVHATETSTNTEVALNVDSVINISAPTTATINCTPGATAAAAQLCTTTVTVGVGTNNITGYTLQMNATNGSPTALTNSAASPAATIPTLSQAYSSSNFPVNSWGYTGGLDKSSETGGYDCSTNGGNYCPILAYNSDSSSYAPNHVIKVTDAPSTTSNTDITFGAKVDISKPSGTYTTSVTFTAVTNYARPSTMQNFTPSDCSRATTDQTFTLMDIRDGTNYTVAKLQDGNCWMTQNLELGEYGHPMTLTQADSNVSPSGYTLEHRSPNASMYKGNANKYGNYYPWSYATAGSDVDATSEDRHAPYDICPKNWRLPHIADQNDYESNEFYKMLSHYVITGTRGNGYWSEVDLSELTSTPISLTLSGNSGSSGGTSALWWSDWGYNNGPAAFMSASSTSIRPIIINHPGIGGSVRCLVPGT